MERSEELVQPFGVEVSQRDGVQHLRLQGELDMASAPALKEQLHSLPHGNRQLIIDLRGLTFLDSTGLSTLLGAHVAGGDGQHAVSFIRGEPSVHKVFEITRTDGTVVWVDPPN